MKLLTVRVSESLPAPLPERGFADFPETTAGHDSYRTAASARTAQVLRSGAIARPHTLTVVDQFTGECVGLETDRSTTGTKVAPPEATAINGSGLKTDLSGVSQQTAPQVFERGAISLAGRRPKKTPTSRS